MERIWTRATAASYTPCQGGKREREYNIEKYTNYWADDMNKRQEYLLTSWLNRVTNTLTMFFRLTLDTLRKWWWWTGLQNLLIAVLLSKLFQILILTVDNQTQTTIMWKIPPPPTGQYLPDWKTGKRTVFFSNTNKYEEKEKSNNHCEGEKIGTQTTTTQ